MSDSDSGAALSSVDRSRLSRAISSIRTDEQGTYSWSAFDQVQVDVQIAATQAPDPLAKAHRYLVAIHHSVWSVLTTVSKLRWMQIQRQQEQLEALQFCFYATSDIEHFHVQVRAALDYLARAIKVACASGRTPDSFHDLRKRAIDGKLDEVLDSSLVTAVLDCDWFEHLRDVRDEIVHRGAQSLVFPDTSRLLFQVHTAGLQRKVLIEPVMSGPNVADFELYAALIGARLLDLLERVAAPIRSCLGLHDERDMGGRNQHDGWKGLHAWMSRLLDSSAGDEAASVEPSGGR